MSSEDIMNILFDTKNQVTSQIIEDIVTFNCTPEDAKQFLSAIDIYEKVLLGNLSIFQSQHQLLADDDYKEEQDDNIDIDIDSLVLN